VLSPLMGLQAMLITTGVGEVLQLSSVVLPNREAPQAGFEDRLQFAGFDLFVQRALGMFIEVSTHRSVSGLIQSPSAGRGDRESGVTRVDRPVRVPCGYQQLSPCREIAGSGLRYSGKSLELLDEILGLRGVLVPERDARSPRYGLVEDTSGMEQSGDRAGGAHRLGMPPQRFLRAGAEVPVRVGNPHLVLERLHQRLLHITGEMTVARADEVVLPRPVGAVQPALDLDHFLPTAPEEDVGAHRQQRFEDLRRDLSPGGAGATVRQAHVAAYLLHGLRRDSPILTVAV